MTDDEAATPAIDQIENTAPALFELEPTNEPLIRPLADDYVVPPFSVLDTKPGTWRDRVNRWKSLGIQSELGRDASLTYGSFAGDWKVSSFDKWEEGSTSIFDPLLTEILLRWYSPAGGRVLDPFAGGSVRGIVTSVLGREYYGHELSDRQVEANREQAATILADESVTMPRWYNGDSLQTIPQHHPLDVTGDFDFILTCPPYADLEVYSDHPADLSNMTEAAFTDAYRAILREAVLRLRRDRFAVIVVGRLRRKDGTMRDFVGETIAAMEQAGAAFYDEAILYTTIGTAAVRARKQMEVSRKLVRVHQNVLTFIKGDPRKATAAILEADK